MSTRFMRSACTARAAAASPNATASCIASTSSRARWPRRSAATAAIRHLKTSSWERERHQERAARVKAILTAAGLPVMSSDTHIVPVFVGDPENCKKASDILLEEHGIYIQPINYPTVAKGTERLRITPSPYHDDGLIDRLAEALLQVWERLGLPLREKSLAAE